MDAITRSRIFEPFFTTKDVNKGTGLGLANVYGIVRHSRGHIFVDSELGRGSTFRIFLPMVSPGSGIASDSGIQELPGGSETVLLVDDDDGVRRMTYELLQKVGYRVLEAADGTEALSICEREAGRIDLLLTDAIMPVLSGRAVAERVVLIRPGIRVLFMSGYTEDQVLRRDVQIGDVAFLQKPFSARELTMRVRQVLDGK
jgi:CheY-like chemotaxis protein